MSLTEPKSGSLERVTIPSDLSLLSEVIQGILRPAAAMGYSEDAIFGLNLALEEALANAVKHGNKKDPTKRVHICHCVSPQQAYIAVRDEGEGFDPRAVPDPTQEENLEKPCGRGIMLIRAYMDEVDFNESGNEVRMLLKVNKP